MVQGLGKVQLVYLQKAERKIAAFLNLRPYPFNDLQTVSNIRRKTLRVRLDYLIKTKMIIEHSYPDSKDMDEEVRRGTYYLLNLHNRAAKDLITAYYDQGPVPISKSLHKKMLTFFTRSAQNATEAQKEFLKLATYYKKEIEPFIDKNQPAPRELVQLVNQSRLERHYMEAVTRQLHIFNIRMRMKAKDHTHADEEIVLPSGKLNAYDLLVRCCIKPFQDLPLMNYSTLWNVLDKQGLL